VLLSCIFGGTATFGIDKSLIGITHNYKLRNSAALKSQGCMKKENMN